MSRLLSIGAMLMGSCWTAAGGGVQSALAADGEIDFAKQVRPILAKSCLACHGPDKDEGGLRLHRKAEALAGGDRGPAIVPGNSDDSRLIQFVTGENDEQLIMPPPGDFSPLSETQIGLLRKWIDQGAKWPD
ncbi:MAG: c-type cytochrome domain-containing protein [Pirellulales bacterium]